MPLTDAELRTYYHAMTQDHGISAGKLKVGWDPVRDLERIGIMRDALAAGSGVADPSLMIDADPPTRGCWRSGRPPGRGSRPARVPTVTRRSR
jgi:hypothetical protein